MTNEGMNQASLFDEGFGLFEGFGNDVADAAVVLSEGLAGKKPEKKVVKKAEKTKPVKKVSGGGRQKLVMPVTVIGCGWKHVAEGEGEISIVDAAKAAYEAGYEEVALSKLTTSGESVLYSNPFSSSATDDDRAVSFKDGKVTVVCGMQKAEYQVSDFSEQEEGDISVLDLIEKFTESHPEFSGCALRVEDGIAVPCFEDTGDDGEEPDTFKVWQNGEISEMSNADFHLAFDPSDKKVRLNLFKSSEGVIFPSYTGNYANVQISDFGLKTTAPKSVEEKYKLPFTLVLQTFNKDVVVKEEHFGGKKAVTQKEVLEVLARSYKVYGQSNRKFDFFYDRKNSILSVAVVSGKKGAAAVVPFPALFDVVDGVRVERTRIGTFYGFLDSDGEVESVDFTLSLPKIPKHHLDNIIRLFCLRGEMEMMVVVYYNRFTRQYDFREPKQVATRTSVEYDLTGDMNPGDYVVMQIHSHNKMPAFWSSTDDADECGMGLFGVIGNIGKKMKPSKLFRAGMNGIYKDISEDELFDTGGMAA